MDNAGAAHGSNCGNVIGQLKGNRQAEPVLFSFHLDTVSRGWVSNPRLKMRLFTATVPTLLGGDDKAGIAAFIEAIAVIKEQNLSHGDIEVVFTILEESGLTGSKCLDLNGLKSKKVIVLDEGTVGWIIVQGPAQDTLDEIVKKPLEERGRWVRGMEGDFSFLARLTPNVFWG